MTTTGSQSPIEWEIEYQQARISGIDSLIARTSSEVIKEKLLESRSDACTIIASLRRESAQ